MMTLSTALHRKTCVRWISALVSACFLAEGALPPRVSATVASPAEGNIAVSSKLAPSTSPKPLKQLYQTAMMIEFLKAIQRKGKTSLSPGHIDQFERKFRIRWSDQHRRALETLAIPPAVKAKLVDELDETLLMCLLLPRTVFSRSPQTVCGWFLDAKTGETSVVEVSGPAAEGAMPVVRVWSDPKSFVREVMSQQ